MKGKDYLVQPWTEEEEANFQRFCESIGEIPEDPVHARRQCLISAEPDESITAAVVQHLGEDYVIWASDYPHLDASFNVVAQIREKISSLPEQTQRKVLGENALRFYGLSY